MYSDFVSWIGDGAERDFKIMFVLLPVAAMVLLAAGVVFGHGPTRADGRRLRRFLR